MRSHALLLWAVVPEPNYLRRKLLLLDASAINRVPR